jgi:hypothetical protein
MSKRDKPLALAAETLCIFAMYCTTWPDTGMPGACCRLYRRLSIPAAVKEVEEEDISESEPGNDK